MCVCVCAGVHLSFPGLFSPTASAFNSGVLHLKSSESRRGRMGLGLWTLSSFALSDLSLVMSSTWPPRGPEAM